MNERLTREKIRAKTMTCDGMERRGSTLNSSLNNRRRTFYCPSIMSGTPLEMDSKNGHGSPLRHRAASADT